MEEKQYVFTQEDLKYVQNLLGDEVKVLLRDNNTIMYTKYNIRNKYIESGYVNFTNNFIKKSKITFLKWEK